MNVRPPRRKQILEECLANGLCPYSVMLDEACKHHLVVANLHAFYFGALNGNLPKRKVLIIDECHTLEDMLRSQLTIQFTVYRQIKEHELIGLKTPQEFASFLKDDKQYLTIPQDGKESYLERLERFEQSGETVYGKQAVVKLVQDTRKTVFEFIPVYVGNAAHNFFFQYADTVVLMSGTIDKAQLARLGIPADGMAYRRFDSDFPAENRPVVRPRNKSLDLSHKHFDDNFDQCVKDIRGLMKHHHNQRGLIHAPNYRIAMQLATALADTGRVVVHTSDDFAVRLEAFYKSSKPLVFISPSVREGVDFAGDKARWQVILRPPYAPAGDPYIKYLMAHNLWHVYTGMAVKDFQQMLGRIVRSKTDSGVTYLMSSTFDAFLSKTWGMYPEWLRKGFRA